jgi:chorismate mutase
MTDDLTSAFPAEAARQLGWTQVPLMCSREIPVPGSLPRCIRVLLQWNTDLPQDDINHVYLGEAAILRPDLGESQIRILSGG